jgi:alkanesulfonate monooxygenase
MSVEFTLVPTTSRRHLPQYLQQCLSPGGSDTLGRRATLEGAFINVVIDGPGGILTNMDVAAETARATSAVGIVLTHWSGVVYPVVAAQQIAALDRISAGRLSLRFLLGPDGRDRDGTDQASGHVDALRQTDEYLVLLKRLWSNDQPFDHEGPYYSVSGGFVGRKGPQAADLPIRMGGVSGVALDVAGRHATMFELAAATPWEVRGLMQRVEAAAARYGRSGKIRFALPVRLTPSGEDGHVGPSGPLALSGPAARIAQTLLNYAALGICEFMVSGLDDEDSIAAFARDVAPVFRRTAPFQARGGAGFPGPARSNRWAS